MTKLAKAIVGLIIALSLVGGLMHVTPIYACDYNPQTCPCPGC